MANEVQGNAIYIDTSGAAGPNEPVEISEIIMSTTHASTVAVLELETNNSSRSYPEVMYLRLDPAIEKTKHFKFKEGLFFPQGVYVGTLTSCKATLIRRRRGGS